MVFTDGRRPYIGKDDLDDEATFFLREHYPIALDMAVAVPVVQIAADIGLTLIAHEHLSEDFSVYGQMCFTGGSVDVWRDMECEYASIEVRPGTMLIDPFTKWYRNAGCYNNTVAHELFHWYRHREYFESLSRKGGMAVTATRCTAAQIEGRAGWRCRSDLDWIEWQATSIAPRILMPKDSFERAAMKSCADHKGQFHSNKAYFHQVVTDIVDIFHVSRESAAIRIKETGYMRRFQ